MSSWRLAIALVCALEATAVADGAWRVDVQWWNDLFADPPPADDQGFTNDFLFGYARARGALTYDVTVFHRMVTERYGRRRWDQVDLTGGVARGHAWRGFDVRVGGRGGLGLGGNFGGCAIQNTWHRVTGSGATADEGLQNVYDGERRAALLIGSAATAERAFSYGRGHAAFDGQLALGATGVSRFEALAGVELGTGRVRAGVDLAVTRYHTGDDNLALRSGYGTGEWHLEPRISVSATAGRYRFGWQYRANEGGSGEPVGIVWFALTSGD